MTTISASFFVRAKRLRRTPWLDVIGAAWLVLVGGMFVKLVLPAQLGYELRHLFLLAPVLVLIAKDLSHLPDALERTRQALRTRTWRKLPAAWLPPEFLGLLRLDGALRRGFADWLLRRPHIAAPAGQAFGYLQFGAYRTACAILLVSTLVELPLDAAIVPWLIADDSKRMAIHLLMLAGALSSIVYMLGDRRLLGKGCHVLTGDALELRVGARSHGSVPLEAIVACERLNESADAWRRRHGIDACDSVRVSPLDKPNAVLRLQPGNTVRLAHHGVERRGLRCIFLYLDRPAALIDALAGKPQ
ncbi:hypothetical protein ACFQ09_09885 [Massilia norwichensis]|uniref:Transmembrane protein n=1 Tax=Massilia norwichensis TaxID=1442366 RepID=A0ABT2A206_9BURK|nr:hypothetical protein [Massilia norwichensis]MCS0588223.1 hypothetical protein [Massilia norwichensis]